METGNLVRVGVDFGGDSCRVSLVDKNNKISLHVNRVSNRQTPSLVAFDKRLRIYGEEAEARSSTLFKNSIPLLSYIVGLDGEELVDFVKSKRYLFYLQVDETNGSFNVTFDDSPLQVYPIEPFSFFLNKVLETVRNEFDLKDNGNEFIGLSLAVPSYFSEKFKSRIHKSLSLSNFKNVKLFKESECILKRWCDSQLPDVYKEFLNYVGSDESNPVPMKVAFLDVGFVHSTFFVAQINYEDSSLVSKVISESSSDSVGTYYVFEALCNYAKDKIDSLSKTKMVVPSKQSYYLYKSSVKCVKELSVLNDAKLDVERVLGDDEDFTTNVTRSQLEELVKPVEAKFCELIEEVLDKTDRENYLSLEMLGGGSRMPFVKNVATKYAELLRCVKKTRTSLDTTSVVSYGATQLLNEFLTQTTAETNHSNHLDNDDVEMGEDLSEYLEKERYVSGLENEQMMKMTTLNEIDNYVIKTKSDLGGSYKSFVEEESLEKVEEALNQLQNFSSDSMNDKSVTSKDCQDNLKSTQEKLKEFAPKYFEKLEEDRLKRLQEERESENSPLKNTPKEFDMDVVLPNKTCIKRAQKNKEEGNELIGAGNVEMAVQHYVKVIQYCAKVSNPSEEEKSTVNDLRLASNLNLAMCYLKMDVPASFNKAVSCCTTALSISPNNTKALFRRAVAYEKLNDFDNAIKDVNRGLELDSENKDFKNMCERVEKKIKLELQKQKKRDYRYMRRVDRLAKTVKHVLFFSYPASVNCSRSNFENSDSTDTQYQSSNNSMQLSSSQATNLNCESDSEYEDVQYTDSEVPVILKSTKQCKDELISRINFSYTSPAQVKSIYGISPIDYRINSLKDALCHLNNIQTDNAV